MTDDRPRIIDLRRLLLERYAGLSKQDLKAIHDLRKPKNQRHQEILHVMQPPNLLLGELADYTRDLTQQPSQALFF